MRSVFYIPLILTLLGVMKSADSAQIAVFFALDADLNRFAREIALTSTKLKVGKVPVQRFSIRGNVLDAIRIGAGCVKTSFTVGAVTGSRNYDVIISIAPAGSLDESTKRLEWYSISSVLPWQKVSSGNGEEMADESARIEVVAPGWLSGVWKNLKSISLASGEAFIANSDFRSRLAQRTNCQAVDMNLFGIVEGPNESQVPQIHYRVISDYADDEAAKDFKDFLKIYDGTGGGALANWFRSLPPDPTSPQNYEHLK